MPAIDTNEKHTNPVSNLRAVASAKAKKSSEP